MSTLALTPTFGLAEIQRASLRVLFATVNDVIDEMNAAKTQEDIAFETFLGRPDPKGTLVEHIAPENFHEGHRPSLIKAPVENYPNLCCWTVRAVPTGESSSSDHSDIFSVLLFIEMMVRATAQEDEEDVNRRISRTAEAAHIALGRDPYMGGLISGMTAPPTLNLSDVFVRREQTSFGPQWYWQGARLEYAVRKDAVQPSSTPGSIFAPRSSLFEGLDIDQQ